MKEETEHKQLSCPICNGESTVIDVVKTINPNSEKKIELRECCVCRHWFHSPIPNQEQLSKMYETASEFVVPKNYTGNDMKQANALSKNDLAGFTSWLCSNEKKYSARSYLEIGVGGGQLLKYFLKKGLVCHGIDPGTKNANLELFPNIDSLPFDKYDIIVLSDTLEHLESPLRMLQDLKKKATKGTRIYCSFPNKDSLPAAIRKGSWWCVRPLGHIHYFSERSVFAMFNKTGWDIKELQKVNALHNELFSSLNPLIITKKILTIPTYWKDQFWVHALSN